MTDILGLQGLTTSDGIEKLIAVFGNDFHIWNPTLDNWEGQSVNVTSNTRKWRSEIFLDSAYFVPGWRKITSGTTVSNGTVMRFNGTSWFDEVATNRSPNSIYIRRVGDRLYMANLYLERTDYWFPSMVWFSDLPDENKITWGLEEGRVAGTKGDRIIRTFDKGMYFKSRNIKIGDPVTFLGNTVRSTYTIASIQSENQLTLTEDLETGIFNEAAFLGGNWFNVSPNDGDVITGLGDNIGRLLVFKRDSLYRFTPGLNSSLVKVRNVPGTTSQESVVNVKEYTYYFHDTGIWRTDGTSAQLVSRGVQDYIDAISPDALPNVAAWTVNNDETVRFYVGTVTDVDNNINIEHCILDYDTITQKCTPGKLPFGITTATRFRESNTSNIYLGLDDGRVVQADTGTMDIDTAIPFMINTGFKFPAGTSLMNELRKMQVHAKQGRGLQVMFKLYGTPFTIDKEWKTLGDIKDYITEFKIEGKFEKNNIARGIAVKIAGNSTLKTPVIDKIDIFYKPLSDRSK